MIKTTKNYSRPYKLITIDGKLLLTDINPSSKTDNNLVREISEMAKLNGNIITFLKPTKLQISKLKDKFITLQQLKSKLEEEYNFFFEQ